MVSSFSFQKSSEVVDGGKLCRNKSYIVHLNSPVFSSCPYIQANVHIKFTSHLISWQISGNRCHLVSLLIMTFFHYILGYYVTKPVDVLKVTHYQLFSFLLSLKKASITLWTNLYTV